MKHTSAGFSLVELLIVVAIVAILAAAGTGVYVTQHRKTVLNTTAEQIQQALRLARQRAVSQQEGLVWGVHFDNTTPSSAFYAIFKNSPYSSANITEYYPLPTQVRFSNPPAGATLNIEFVKRTGTTGADASIQIQLAPEGTLRTISVSTAGLIEIQ